jgi:cytochrome c biogenesis protein CcdA/thiol-disulfide isomerase/thioredoxin
MLFLLAFSFLAGFATILAPCIWPLLPLVLSVSSTGGKRKPFGLTLGVMTSFTLFTLFVSYLERFLHIDANFFRLVAVVVIGFLGLSLLFPALGARFESWVNRVLQPLQNRLQGNGEGQGFGAGYAAGFSIGLVWAPCAGPILATIATLAATQSVSFQVILVTLAYAVGLGIPLFLVALGGSVLFARMRQVNKYTGRIQQVFGVIMIAVALLIYTNYDKTIQLRILQAFPSYGNLLNGVENNKIVSAQLDSLRGTKAREESGEKGGELPDLGPAPEFTGITNWLNSPPLTLASLKGKVVLVDFWTYSCINCLRTLPNTKAWWQKYGPDHFTLIGVHAPEFAFEKETSNVQKALKQFDITYPVPQDNDFATWKAYHNEYWPAEYLIDANGTLRHTKFGEGDYDGTERLIRQLLTDANPNLKLPGATNTADATPRTRLTPETYLGAGKAVNYGGDGEYRAGTATFAFPATLPDDRFALRGLWTLDDQGATADGDDAAIRLNYTAKDVYVVVGGTGTITVTRGGQTAATTIGGPPTLHQIAGNEVGDTAHRDQLDMRVGKGLQVFSFTFG